ncbi:MAG: quinone-dependent dihydroorotate dehydrogenase [Rhodobacteraceae bacterium]|nr:quinone-dependent dihydroorotate dehydrogenase [Paracoccaceae bacterium]
MVDLYRLVWPVLAAIDAERAHGLALRALKSGIAAALLSDKFEHSSLATKVWDLNFGSPIGLAAGFDKNAEALAGLFDLGFGFVEIGGVTPLPQPGNPKPRLFRLAEDWAVINRFGFNSDGIDAVRSRMAAWRAAGHRNLVGVNLGKNKAASDAAADYAAGVAAFAPLADFLVINVSSPNTPGLRALQSTEPLIEIIKAARDACASSGANVPLLLKIAPDLTSDDVAAACRAGLEQGIDGFVVSNTTTARPEALKSPHKTEAGGLSGAPLFEPSTRLLREVYALTEGRVPLIGVGGVASGADAYAKIRAGASLVQIYSALVFQGPALVGRIKRDLVALLTRDGFTSVGQAVGADHDSPGGKIQ